MNQELFEACFEVERTDKRDSIVNLEKAIDGIMIYLILWDMEFNIHDLSDLELALDNLKSLINTVKRKVIE